MKLLTTTEELILLSVWRLGDKAYSKSIHKEISALSGKEWSLGSIYMPLERLLKREMVKTWLSDSVPERGGRHKRIYQLTDKGKLALNNMRAVKDNIWNGIPVFTVGKNK